MTIYLISGGQAKERGLVDELGGIDRAIELLKDRAKIGKDEKVAVVTYAHPGLLRLMPYAIELR